LCIGSSASAGSFLGGRWPVSSGSGELSSYAELVDVLGLLPVLVREARRRRRLSLRAAAAQMGVSPSTAMRIEEGQDCALSNAVAVLRWLDGAVTTAAEPPAEGGISKGVVDV
jgi:hypothetical protein